MIYINLAFLKVWSCYANLCIALLAVLQFNISLSIHPDSLRYTTTKRWRGARRRAATRTDGQTAAQPHSSILHTHTGMHAHSHTHNLRPTATSWSTAHRAWYGWEKQQQRACWAKAPVSAGNSQIQLHLGNIAQESKSCKPTIVYTTQQQYLVILYQVQQVANSSALYTSS